jgi:hypothetical protein
MDTTFASTASEFTPEGWQRETDKLLAKLIVSRELATVEQLQECLREMKQTQESDPTLTLGQMLVKKRLLDPRKFSEVYRSQRELLFSCRQCRKTYTLPELNARKSFSCEACQNKLDEPETLQQIVLDRLLIGSGLNAAELGNYVVLHEIARGGMGIVYKARHKELGRIVALKVLRDIDAADADALARFKREISVSGKLQHPHIVNVLDAGQAGSTVYFTMQYIEGVPLDKKIKQAVYKSKEAAQLMEKVARAVHYAHRQEVIHRDIKPANILLDAQGEPHIIDFGLAKDLSHNTRLTHTGAAMGTPYYMAPEQIEGKACGPAVDIYALGVVLYEMLTQSQPFSASSQAELYCKILTQPPTPPRELNAQIPAELEAIILKAMMKLPAERYLSAKALADDLQKFRQGKGVSARPLSAWRRGLRQWRKKLPWAVAISCLLFLALTAFTMRLLAPVKPSTEAILQQEIERRVQEVAGLWRQKQTTAARQKTQQILAAYPDVALTLSLHAMAARADEESGDSESAVTNWQRLYVETGQREEQRTAVAGLLRCTLQRSEFVRAAHIVAIALRLSPQPDAELSALAARAYFHGGEWEKAQTMFVRLDTLRSKQEADLSEQYCRRWLKSLLPVRSYAVSGNVLRVLPLGMNGTWRVLMVEPEQIHLYGMMQGNLRQLSTLSAPAGFQFGPALAAGNVTGNREPDLVAGIYHPQKKEHALAVFVQNESHFALSFRFELETGANDLWAGQLGRGPCAIIVAAGLPRRGTSVFLRASDRWVRRDLDSKLRESCTDPLCIDVGDLNADGVVEIIIGTSCWTFYDVRVYACSNDFTSFALRANKRLGVVSDCKIGDMDGDGRPEILVGKSYTHNSALFGNASPYGETDGLYVFRYRPGALDEVWRQTYPASGNPQRGFSILGAAKMKGGTRAAVVLMNTVSLSKRATGESRSSAQEIWLVDSQDGQYRALPFTSTEPLLGCGLGDVDGDGCHELLLLKQGQLFVCGLSESTTPLKASGEK